MLPKQKKGIITLLLGVLLIGAMLVPATPVFADEASMFVSPSSQTVEPGESFTVYIYVSVDQPSLGAQCDLYYDPALLQVDSVTKGTFYSGWADAQTPPVSYAFVYPSIDNDAGLLDDGGIGLGGTDEGPNGTGYYLVINMTALDGVSGISSLALADTALGDVEGFNIAHSTVDGTVTVGDVVGPDLVVSDITPSWIDEDSYNIDYTVTNQGSEDAGDSTTEIDIDGDVTTTACPALTAGEEYNDTVGPFTLSDGEDTITVTADVNSEITEGNESNNVAQYTLAPDKMVVEGVLVGDIVLAVPENILEWELGVGENSQDGTLNVKCNTDWQVTVSDDDATTAGHMTEWDGSAYGTEYLDNEMVVACLLQDTAIGLESSGTVATGSIAGQGDDNAGEDVALTFKQYVEYADPILDESVYRIIITFTGSITF